MARYCDKRGVAISEQKWRELHADYDYVHLGEYETDTTLIQAVWHGRVDPKAHEMFWEPFAVLAWWRSDSGKWAEEPTQHNFGDPDDAIKYFHKTLNYEFPEDCYSELDAGGTEYFTMKNNKAQERIEAERKEAEERKAAIEQAQMEKMQKLLERQQAIELEALRVQKLKERELKLAKELDEIAELATKGDDYGSWS